MDVRRRFYVLIMLKKFSFAKTLVLLCTVVYFASYFSRKSFAAVMVAMLDQGAVERHTAGLIGTALFIFYGLGQVFSGLLGDRFSAKILLPVGLFVSAVCNFLLPLIKTDFLMIGIWGLNGLAQALLWPPIVRLLSENLPHEKYVTANLIVTCGAHVATILLYLYTTICLQFFTWETVFFTATAICVLVGVVFFFALSKTVSGIEFSQKNTHTGTENASKPLLSTFFDSGLIYVFVCIIAMGFLRDGIESWLPTLYSEAFSRNASESVLVSVALPIFSIVSILLIRIVHKNKFFNNETRGAIVLFLLSVALCVPLGLLINQDGAFCRVLCLILACAACACMHACNFLFISCVPGRFSQSGRTSSIGGFCNAFTYVGAAGSTYGIALLSERLGWSATAFSWAGISLIGVLFALLALKKYTAFLHSTDPEQKEEN